jgi:hypothetical protein
MRRKIVFFLLLVSIISCSIQAPKENEVKDLVKQWYEQQSASDGAGRWDINGVTVLSIKKDEQRKDVFKTVSLATGVHHSAPLPEPQPDKNFSDTVRMDLYWNGAKWTTAE